jgi:hypothetical protein
VINGLKANSLIINTGVTIDTLVINVSATINNSGTISRIEVAQTAGTVTLQGNGTYPATVQDPGSNVVDNTDNQTPIATTTSLP